MQTVRTNTGLGVQIVPSEGDSREVMDIALSIIPEWLNMFAKKNADYGSEGAKVLGIKGQYADMNRKMLKLKRAVWDDQTMHFEQPEEILMDLIGHCALTIQMLREKDGLARQAVFGDGDIGMDAVRELVDGFQGANEPAPDDETEGFSYSEELQQAMLAERLAHGRRQALDMEVAAAETKWSADYPNNRLEIRREDGNYTVENDGSIYKNYQDADRVEMKLVPAAELEYLASLGGAMKEDAR